MLPITATNVLDIINLLYWADQYNVVINHKIIVYTINKFIKRIL